MTDGKKFFDKVTYENIRKVATNQVDNYTTSCL